MDHGALVREQIGLWIACAIADNPAITHDGIAEGLCDTHGPVGRLIAMIPREGGGAVVDEADSNRPTAEGNVSRNPAVPGAMTDEDHDLLRWGDLPPTTGSPYDLDPAHPRYPTKQDITDSPVSP